MRTTLLFALIICLTLLGHSINSMNTIQAAEKTQLKSITLDVENMTCRMCPVTVRKALKKIDGVINVEAKYEGNGVGWAQVTYDPVRVNLETLTKVTTQAGYPSTLRSP